MSYHLILRMVITTREEVSTGKDVEKRESLHVIGGNINWCSHYGKQYRGLAQN